jgi:hypothetical protein
MLAEKGARRASPVHSRTANDKSQEVETRILVIWRYQDGNGRLAIEQVEATLQIGQCV